MFLHVIPQRREKVGVSLFGISSVSGGRYIQVSCPRFFHRSRSARTQPRRRSVAAAPPRGNVSSMRVLSAYNPVSLAVNVARENLFATVGYAYPPEVDLLRLLACAVVLIGIALVVATRQLRTK